MTTMKRLLIGTTVAIGLLLVVSMRPEPQAQPEEWVVPAKYQKLENPSRGNTESLGTGKMLYKKHCASCHGNTGMGDGVKARTLDTPSGDFTDEEFQSQTDGALFYKIKSGRNDMPKFDSKIEDEDVWLVINYIRTLKK